MIEIFPLTVSEYINLEDKTDYNFVMKYAFRFTEPIDEYHIGDMMELSFGFVKDFQFEIEKGLTMDKIVDFVLKATNKKTIKNELLDKFCRFTNFLVSGIKDILEIEQKALAYEPSGKEEGAGIDRFKDLGIYLQIRSLTKGDVTKVEEVRALPYSICFLELYTSKQISEYEKELNKIKPG